MTQKTYCGLVGIIGRPNVGKSTLLNALLQEKVSITANKPQTTRHRILGIQTKAQHQIIYVDTPGLHQGYTTKLNRHLNRVASHTINDVEMIIFIVDRMEWKEDDEWILSQLKTVKCPVLLLVNKVDQIKEKDKLLPHLQLLSEKMSFQAIFPISALKKINLPELENTIMKLLPENNFLFPEDQLTDRSEIFLTAEFIREKIIRAVGEELPYATTVQIEKFELKKDIYHISAIIWVERSGQKKIMIGKGGEKLKQIGTRSRCDLEKMLNHKVFLQLWVKVKSGWSNDESVLGDFGYREE